MAIKYKQRCFRCKTNFVVASRRDRFVQCYDCQKKELSGEIKDPVMKKMFDIPEEFYKENSFLRSIKRNYLTYDSLSEKQIETFKRVAQEMADEKKNTPKEIPEEASGEKSEDPSPEESKEDKEEE